MERLDFAVHYLEAKKKLNDVYVRLNEREYAPAVGAIDEIIAELRLMRTAVKTHIKDHHG